MHTLFSFHHTKQQLNIAHTDTHSHSHTHSHTLAGIASRRGASHMGAGLPLLFTREPLETRPHLPLPLPLPPT